MSEDNPFERLRENVTKDLPVSQQLLDGIEASEGKQTEITASVVAAVILLEKRVAALEKRNRDGDTRERLAL